MDSYLRQKILETKVGENFQNLCMKKEKILTIFGKGQEQGIVIQKLWRYSRPQNPIKIVIIVGKLNVNMLALPHNLLLRQQFIILISFLSSLKRQPGKHVIIPLPRNHGDLYKTNNLDIRSSVLSVGKVCHGSMSSSAMLCTRLYKKTGNICWLLHKNWLNLYVIWYSNRP